VRALHCPRSHRLAGKSDSQRLLCRPAIGHSATLTARGLVSEWLPGSLARRALALEPDHLTALSVCGQALSCLRREAIALLERAVGLTRATAFVGPLGYVYAVAGRTEDAARLRDESGDRVRRGEYVPAAALMAIYTGLRDVPGVRGALSMALAQNAPRISLQGFGGLILQSTAH